MRCASFLLVLVRPAISIPERHYGVDAAQHQQCDGKRNMHQQPGVEPMVEAALAAELVLFCADIFQIIESWMECRRRCSPQRFEDRGSRRFRRVEKRADGLGVGFAEANLIVVLRFDSKRGY